MEIPNVAYCGVRDIDQEGRFGLVGEQQRAAGYLDGEK